MVRKLLFQRRISENMNCRALRLKTVVVGGFTLTESVIAIAVGSLMFAGLYACFAWGFSTVRAARENLRATQIMLKHLESVRLCTFTQLTDTNYNPATFTDYYDPKDQSSGTGGAVYSGTYSATVPASGALPDSYRTNMLLVTIGVSWTSGNVQRSRSMQTYISQNGIDSYVSTGQ
jgi:prepilin-type N-terminal cleavage/methylation domain-containing protein